MLSEVGDEARDDVAQAECPHRPANRCAQCVCVGAWLTPIIHTHTQHVHELQASRAAVVGGGGGGCGCVYVCPSQCIVSCRMVVNMGHTMVDVPAMLCAAVYERCVQCTCRAILTDKPCVALGRCLTTLNIYGRAPCRCHDGHD